MHRARSILGLIAGALMIVSSAAHSFLGWKAQREALEAANAPADLIHMLGIGWHFGGAAMLAFGFIVIALFLRDLSAARVPLMPAIVIGTTYVAFGAGATLVSHLDPFFLVFVIPGVFVLIATLWRRAV
jgi:hypothetical protein